MQYEIPRDHFESDNINGGDSPEPDDPLPLRSRGVGASENPENEPASARMSADETRGLGHIGLEGPQVDRAQEFIADGASAEPTRRERRTARRQERAISPEVLAAQSILGGWRHDGRKGFRQAHNRSGRAPRAI
jgi:hypothetical protein